MSDKHDQRTTAALQEQLATLEQTWRELNAIAPAQATSVLDFFHLFVTASVAAAEAGAPASRTAAEAQADILETLRIMRPLIPARLYAVLDAFASRVATMVTHEDGESTAG